MESSLSSINLSEDAHPSRRSGNFHPSVWGDFFLSYEALEICPEDEKLELTQLKEEITMILKKPCGQSSVMIDNIQRLGLWYHFEDEIDAWLMNIYEMMHQETSFTDNEAREENLHTVALRFRLLRQQGFRVSSDILKKFLNKEGKWDESSTSDVLGILSLYEASYYVVHGENILEEALIFTTAALKCMLSNSSDFVARLIDHALQWPIRKTLNRAGARLFISLYQQDESHDAVLLKLAKLDFNAVQRMYKRELCALTRWWKRIDSAKNFPFAKDRLVETFYISMGLQFEPQYSQGRILVAKQLSLTLTMDDTYDTHATLDELVLFTDAIQSWNMDAVNHLPSYMRPLYKAILEFYTELEEDLKKFDKSGQIEFAKEEMKKVVKAYYKDAYWHHNNYVPTMEEYMEPAQRTSLVTMASTTSYFVMKNLVMEEVLKWVMSDPLIIRAASTITRLVDDLQDHEDGGNDVKSYMSEYGVSKKKAIDELNKQITDAWKDVNNESLLLTTTMQSTIIERLINTSRIMHTLFKDIDGFTHSTSITKNLIKAVLVDPINY